MKRWIILGAILVFIVVMAPFGLLTIKAGQATALALVTHYQSLVLALVTLSVAILAVITFVGLDERVERRVLHLSEQIKLDNKMKLRLLWDLEHAQNDASALEEVVERLGDNSETFRLFREDLRRAFDAFVPPNGVTAATAEFLARALRESARDREHPSWPFWVNLSRQSAAGWCSALEYVNLLKKDERDRVLAWLPWIWTQWDPKRSDDWNEAVSGLADALARRFDLNELCRLQMERLCKEKYPATNEYLWSSPPSDSGGRIARWYVRHVNGPLAMWETRYGDLFHGMLPNNYIDIKGEPTDIRAWISQDLKNRGAEQYERLEEANSVKTVAIYPYDLMVQAIHDESESLPYGILLVARTKYSALDPLPQGTHWFQFLEQFEHDQKVEVLWVDDKPVEPSLSPTGAIRSW